MFFLNFLVFIFFNYFLCSTVLAKLVDLFQPFFWDGGGDSSALSSL